MNRSNDLISVLTQDHRELQQLYTELEHLSGGEPLRRTLTDQLIVEVIRHAVAEECYLCPVCRERLPDGDRMVDEALADHRRLAAVMRRLEAPDVPDEEFARLLSGMTAQARSHIECEEEGLFPLLAEHVSEKELIELGKKAERSKAFAPSRISDRIDGRPLLHTFLSSGAGLVERVRRHLCGQDKAYPGAR